MTQTNITMRVALNGTAAGIIEGFNFSAQVHGEPSIDGICEGRVSRLLVSKGREVILHYDRCWYIPVTESCRAIYDRLMKALETLPS